MCKMYHRAEINRKNFLSSGARSEFRFGNSLFPSKNALFSLHFSREPEEGNQKSC